MIAKSEVEVETPSPPEVELLDVTVVSPKLVIISWDGNDDVYSYEVSRVQDSEGKLLAEFPSEITFYPDGRISPHEYCWNIKAKSGWGEDVKEVCTKVPRGASKPLPPSPAHLKAKTYEDKVTLTWFRKGREMGFKVLRCKAEDKHCTPEIAVGLAPEGATSYVDKVNEDRYCYRVVAYGVGGDSGFSNTVCVEVRCNKTFLYDLDGDGWGSIEVIACKMPEGTTTISGDCDDTNPSVNPGADEVCDGIDNDCDGSVDFPIPFDMPAISCGSPEIPRKLSKIFKFCFETNPSYPSKTTYTCADYSCKVSYIVINSEGELDALCSKESYLYPQCR